MQHDLNSPQLNLPRVPRPGDNNTVHAAGGTNGDQGASYRQILDVADAIEQMYRDEGYILVRAYVPPQRVRDGVFTINVVEGKIAHVTVEGGTPATQAQIKGYVQPSLNRSPMPLAVMERSLLLANDLPGVVASGTLKPAEDIPGASDVVVTVDQPRVTGGLGADNRGSRFSGLWTLNADAEVNSILDSADQLAGTFTTSPDASEQVAGELPRRREGHLRAQPRHRGNHQHREPGRQSKLTRERPIPRSVRGAWVHAHRQVDRHPTEPRPQDGRLRAHDDAPVLFAAVRPAHLPPRRLPGEEQRHERAPEAEQPAPQALLHACRGGRLGRVRDRHEGAHGLLYLGPTLVNTHHRSLVAGGWSSVETRLSPADEAPSIHHERWIPMFAA